MAYLFLVSLLLACEVAQKSLKNGYNSKQRAIDTQAKKHFDNTPYHWKAAFFHRIL